jgi:hypothetical protein
MFEWVTAKPSKTEKPAWLGVAASLVGIFCGAVAIVRHRVLGWPIIVWGAVALVMEIRRLNARRRNETRRTTENL